MPYRPARYTDLLPASQLAARAFSNEPLFGDLIHPNRHKYPNDMYLYFLSRLRLIYVSGPDDKLFVAYKIDPLTGKEILTGIAHWFRWRKDALPPKKSYAVRRMAWLNYFESFMYPNRAADPQKENILAEGFPFMAHHWTGSRGDLWDLRLLAVDPCQERQGIGGELVKWGFERAREEGVGCSVISAAGKEKFYERCGFDVVAGNCRDEGGEANPFRNVEGGTIMFWDNGRSLEGLKRYGEV